jgi:hemolysin III
VLATIWTLAVLGAVLSVLWLQMPRAVLALVCVGVGWVAIGVLPQLVWRLGPGGLLFLLGGGGLYSAGALVYAVRRPVLWPRVFGFHELFHLLVIAGNAVFFAFIATEVIAVRHG